MQVRAKIEVPARITRPSRKVLLTAFRRLSSLCHYFNISFFRAELSHRSKLCAGVGKSNAGVMLSVFAAIFYLVVSASCFAACKTANRHGRSLGSPSCHFIAFLVLAGLFAGLAVYRILAVEDFLRAEMRGVLKSLAVYEERRAWQSAMLAAAASLMTLIGIWGAKRFQEQHLSIPDKLLLGSLAAALAMLILIEVRLISHHGVDRVLYDFKLNWMLDLGLSFAVMISAVLYRRNVQNRTAKPRKVRPRVQMQ
ncbi:MAG: hypothetical protein AAGK17_08525 [Pseudomonadota bacterium]